MDPMYMVFFLLVGLAYSSFATVCPGCPVNQDANSPSVINNLKLTLAKTKAIAEGVKGELTEVLRVIRVTSQVVAGLKYTYDYEAKGINTNNRYQCHLVFVYRPWVEETNILEYNCHNVNLQRNKRSLPGGISDISVHDVADLPRVKAEITKEFNKNFKSVNLMGIVKIIKASKQIVNGVLFRVKVEIAESSCPVSSSDSLEKCTFKKQGHQVCDVEVLEEPFYSGVKPQTKVTVKKCTPAPQVCAGCPVESSPSDKSAREFLQKSLFKLNAEPGSKKKWSLRQIKHVRTQVVAGVLYSIEFEAEDENKLVYNCTAVILYQPWLSKEPSLSDFKCSEIQPKQYI